MTKHSAVCAVLAVLALAGCQPKSAPKTESSAPPAAPAAPAAPVVAATDTAVWEVTGTLVTTGSGLRYWDASIGTGAEAKAGMTVSVHYVGRLESGEVFDQSYSRGAPIVFRLGAGQVIKGWEQGIEGMKVGGRRKLVIPSPLAYGDAGYGGLIPPKATLVFQVTLTDAR